MGLTIVTAGRGEGKTTFLRAYAAWHAGRGRSIGGVASAAVFEREARVGYDLLDIRSGRRRPLARVAVQGGPPPTLGMYTFDDEALAEGNAAIISAVKDGLGLVAIDEVGRLEFQGNGWTPALCVALTRLSSSQELVVVVRSSLTDQLPLCFPSTKWETASRISPPWPVLPLPQS